MVQFLCVRLKGSARKALKAIDNDLKRSFVDLKGELTSRFDVVQRPDLFKSQLRNRKRQPGETYQQLGNDLRHLAQKAYPELQSKVREELAKDQFVRALEGVELSLKIRHSNPKTLDEAIRMTLEWEAVEFDVKGGHVGHTTAPLSQATGGAAGCGPSNGETSELVSVMKDLLVLMKEEREHKVNSFNGRGRKHTDRHEGSDFAHIRCWNCGLNGHRRASCPKASGRQAPGAVGLVVGKTILDLTARQQGKSRKTKFS